MRLNWGNQWKQLGLIPKILITAGAVVIIVLNMQPFNEIGYGISEEITIIPLVNSISSFPIIGDLVGGFVENVLRWFLFNRGDLISLSIWGTVNYIELLHLFFDGSLWLSIGAYTIELVIHLFKYEVYGSGYEDFIADFGWWILQEWNWFQLLVMIISILGTEIGLGTMKNMWQKN